MFDTATLMDSSLFRGNVLTDYVLEISGARGRKALWLDLFYYEAADAYERVATMQRRATMPDAGHEDMEGADDENRFENR